MSIKSLLMLHTAALSCMDSSVFMSKLPERYLNGDFSKNINPYHSKPIRKGAGKKKLSRKQRKSRNNEQVNCITKKQ